MAETKRSIGQVVFRHTPGSLVAIDEFGVYGEVKEVRGEPDSDIDKNTLYRRVRWFVNKWNDESNEKIRGFELNDLERDSLVAIRPERVLWEFPQFSLFECVDLACKVTINSGDRRFDGKCPRCKKGLRQFRYVWFHTCGNLKPFQPILQVECPTHKRDFLYLQDNGRFKSSFWKCRECNYERRLGMLPCKEGTCVKLPRAESYLRASVWNDPWVYFPQVITFVNLKDENFRPVMESKLKEELLLSSYLGSVQAGKRVLYNKAINDDEQGVMCVNPECGAKINPAFKFCPECSTKQPDIIQSESQPKQDITSSVFTEESELITFSALRDLERSVSFKEERNKLKDSTDIEKKMFFDTAFESFSKIGFRDITLIGDFPLTYAALGYTRFQSKPQVWLRSFPSTRTTGTKIPIYTNCITTEALMIQLSGKHVINWLTVNNLLPDAVIKEKISSLNETDALQWLLSFMNNEEESDEQKIELKNTVKELIHSLSHTFLQSVSVESGLDVASFGEVLLPNVLSFIVYAGESDVGGVTATFNQGINSLLDSLTDQLRLCKFDPSCSEDDDGSCVGCLQLPRGCSLFNDKLSRVHIFGGTKKNENIIKISVGYFDLSNI